MALGAYDVQSARLLDLFRLFGGLGGVLFHQLLVQLPALEYLRVLRLREACYLVYLIVVVAALYKVCLGKELGVSSEHDIGASSCHVGRNGDRAVLSRLSYYLSLPLVVLGVEHLVVYPPLFEH